MDEEKLIDHMKTRQTFFEKERTPVENEWKVLAEYLLPHLEFMFPQENKADRRATKVFNGMPINVGRLLADGLFGNMVSPNLKWLRLCMRNRELEEYPEVKTWLQECEEQMYHALRSGFYGAIHECFEVGGKLGTGIMFIEEDVGQGTIVFDTRELTENYIAENRYRKVDTWHRKFELSAREAVKKFPKEKLSDDLVRNAEKDSQDEKYKFLHAIYPNEDKVYGRVDSKNKEFWSGYIQLDGKKKLLLESGYNKFPGFVWRWRRGNVGPWGMGPGHDALVEVIGLNQMRKDVTKAIHLAVEPALQIPDYIERVRISPRALNKVVEGKGEIKPIHVPSRFPEYFTLEDKIEECIKDHFMVKFFLLMAQADRQRTATEIMELAGEKATVMGAVIGNIDSEAIDQTVDRVFTIEADAGRMPEPPPMIYGEEMEIDHMGPLSQAQKKWLEAQGVQQGLGLSIPFWEHFPEAKDNIDFDKTQRRICVGAGWPQEGMRTEEERDELRKIRAEAVQAERQMEAAERMADAVPKISKKVEEGSVLDKMEKSA